MIDFHCHLDLYPEPSVVVEECRVRQVDVLSVTNTPSAWQGTRQLSAGIPRIRVALGLHPQLAVQRKHELGLFLRYLGETQFVGEIGLDRSVEHEATWQVQLDVFRAILKHCSDAGGKIMTIHSRRAVSAVLDCLSDTPRAGVPILHWFSGSIRELQRAVDIGCWFSINSAMLGTDRGRALVATMPINRILTESDGPFQQIDSRSAVPWDTDRTVMEAGRLLSISPFDLQLTVTENLDRLLQADAAVGGQLF